MSANEPASQASWKLQASSDTNLNHQLDTMIV